MKHLKIFETTAEYNAFKLTENFATPNVSLCEDAPTVIHYEPYVETPIVPQHEYVEIGGIKWATMNLGANSITDPGLYYKWGDTQGYTYDQIDNINPPYYNFENHRPTKYNNEDELITLQPSDDAVNVAWGGNWRMPTISEWQLLIEATNVTYTDNYNNTGIPGLICADKTDNSKVLFFSVAILDPNYNGYGYQDNCIWSSSIDTSYDPIYAKCIYLSGGSNYILDHSQSRESNGHIRGILDDSNS